MQRAPNSKSNLDRAISRFAENDAVRANELGVALANAIVAQMIGAGVVKGGTSLRFRYGEMLTWKSATTKLAMLTRMTR